ncbi:MAG: hypothetical protein KF691_00920 [Phycisphaeraceae bacterium]|nr:hypothetical protein [Phycisphaeraceae bacterium]
MEVRCPRCGYDQTGVMSAWREACPVQGRCSECGLDFLWCDAVAPPRCEGLVEHATTFWRWSWWGVRTFARTWRPMRFWNWLRMEYPPRVWKAVVWFVCAMGILDVAIAAIMLASVAISQWRSGWRSFAEALDNAVTQTMRWETWLWWVPTRIDEPYWNRPRLAAALLRLEIGQYPWWLLPTLMTLCVAPLMLVVLPWTRARAKVELRHVARWLVYSQSLWPVAFVWFEAIYLGYWLQSSAARPTFSATSGFSDPEETLWWQLLDCIAWPMESEWIVPLVLLAWLCRWNWCALKFGMRFEKPAALWWAVMVPTLLVGAIVVMLQAVGLGILLPGLA